MQIGKFFVEELLHINPEQSNSKSPSYLIQRSLDYVQTLAPEVEFEAYCATKHKDEATKLRRIVNSTVVHRVKAIAKGGSNDAACPGASTTANQTGHQTGDEPQEQQEPPSKRAKTGNNKRVLDDLDERHTLRELTSAHDKITCMMRIMERIEEAKTAKNPIKMTSGAKSFVSRSLLLPIKCIRTHFGGDVVAFCQKYPDFAHTTFSKSHCCG